MSSSLSSVVSNLVRASVGSSVPSNVTDEELDRYVADLIVKEAKQKADRYVTEGVQAYLPEKESDRNLPRANKRFLSAIVRNTDEHNRAILKAQAEAAMQAKAEREAQERKERRARALEATEAERLRRLMGGSSRRRTEDWDKGSRRRRTSRDSRNGDKVDYEDELRDRSKRRRYSRSRSPTEKDDDTNQRRRRRHRDEGRDDSSSRKYRRRSRSRTPAENRHKSTRRHDSSRKHRRRDGTPDLPSGKGKGKEKGTEEPSTSCRPSTRATPVGDEPNEASDEGMTEVPKLSRPTERRSWTPQRRASPNLSAQFKERKAKLAATPPPPASPTLSEEEDIERYRPRRRRRASPGPSLPKHDDKGSQSPSTLPSKMDKYFEESYDPRLDTGPLTLPEVPSTGLIEGTEFEGWEAMLDIIRQRREDKAERKRLERLGLLPVTKAKEKDGETSKPSEAWAMESGTNALDIKYSKRGTVREWDLGKPEF